MTLPKVNLRQLILALTCGSVLLTLTISLWSGQLMQRDLLVERSLEANRLYAIKTASSTDLMLRMAQTRLRYASAEITAHWGDVAEMEQTVQRLLQDTHTFNSVLVVTSSGVVRHVEPEHLGLRGVRLETEGAREALGATQPLISEPFVGASGNLLVSMTHPILDPRGNYAGYLSGTVYLQKESILYSLLGEHDFKDGSYLFVVDDEARIIYHQDRSRIGDQVPENPVVAAVTSGQTGSMRLHNSRGVEVLAGYAPVPVAGWGVVAQQPVSVTLANLDTLLWRTVQYTLPGVLVSLVLIWALSTVVSRPLAEIARRARRMDEPGTRMALEQIRPWYFEAARIKASLLTGIAAMTGKMLRLREESHTDQLTGLANRREMALTLAEWREHGVPYCVLVFDIDHFKQVNDVHGHDVGDRVLQEVARILHQVGRQGDLICRTGGEEFAMFLPGASLEAGQQVAERVRQAVAVHVFATGGHLTISCGIAHVPSAAPEPEAAFKAADVALYAAKAAGRNCVMVAA